MQCFAFSTMSDHLSLVYELDKHESVAGAIKNIQKKKKKERKEKKYGMFNLQNVINYHHKKLV